LAKGFGVAQEQVRLRLCGGTDAPARARRALDALNGSLRELRRAVELLVSELVTNCVLHAGAGPSDIWELELSASPEGVRVEVVDPGPGFTPPEQLPTPGAGGKFGLFLVDRVADRWGVDPSRSSVWFELDRTGRHPL
jgi:anti-sigma regulatory factor (Ser/Thr protein kinase)